MLGKTFFKQGVARGLGHDRGRGRAAPRLARPQGGRSSLQADPRSPERGQYGFLQDLVRKVAYDTLSKKERKAKHLAAAASSRRAGPARRTRSSRWSPPTTSAPTRPRPTPTDAEEIRGEGARRSSRAGERAASLAAPAEAQRYFEQALGLADEPLERAELLERAGYARAAGAATGAGRARSWRRIEHFESAGWRTRRRASRRARRGRCGARRVARGGRRAMEGAFDVLRQDEPDADLGDARRRARPAPLLQGRDELAASGSSWRSRSPRRSGCPRCFAGAQHEGIVATARGGRKRVALLQARPRGRARERPLDRRAPRLQQPRGAAYGRDRHAEALELHGAALELAARVGTRWGACIREAMPYPLFMVGRWDEALERAGEHRLGPTAS